MVTRCQGDSGWRLADAGLGGHPSPVPHSFLGWKVSAGETLRQGGKAGGWGQVPVLLCACGLEPVLGHVWPLWPRQHHGTFLCVRPWDPAGNPRDVTLGIFSSLGDMGVN